MNERTQVILYTVVASAVLWIVANRFLGSTDEYASRLDIKSIAPINPGRQANEAAPVNVSSSRAVSPESLRKAAMPGAADGGTAAQDRPGRRGETAQTPVPVGDEERLTADVIVKHGSERRTDEVDAGDTVNRADSDTGLEADLALDGAAKAVRLRVDIARMSEEEAALLDRLDPDLLKAPPPTRALDMKLVGCERPMPPIGVLFRNGTVAIKGGSLNRIDSLVALFRDCEDGMLVIEDNPQGSVDIDGDERLARRRHEELKYYLLQRLVPMESMRFPGDS